MGVKHDYCPNPNCGSGDVVNKIDPLFSERFACNACGYAIMNAAKNTPATAQGRAGEMSEPEVQLDLEYLCRLTRAAIDEAVKDGASYTVKVVPELNAVAVDGPDYLDMACGDEYLNEYRAASALVHGIVEMLLIRKLGAVPKEA